MNSQKGIFKKFSFTTSSKRIKYLRVNLIKDVKDLYIKNYMMLMKETEHTKKWKDKSVLVDLKN